MLKQHLPVAGILRYDTLLSILVVGLIAIIPLRAKAQTFRVESSSPNNEATSVSITTTIRFEFNRPVSTLTDWNTQFAYEPRGAVEVRRVNLLVDAQGQPTIVEYEVEHQADTDYTWVVYAVESRSGLNMTEPYVLRYTTATTRGVHSMAGLVSSPTASLEQKAVGGSPSLSRLAWRQITHMARSSGLGSPVFSKPSSAHGRRTSRASPTLDAVNDGAKRVTKHTDDSPDFTSIFLLENYTERENDWVVTGATAIQGASGSYSVDGLRDGRYWPLAVRYADRDQMEITALGFHDANQDGRPDSVDINGGSLTGIDIDLFEYPRTAASVYLADAQNVANEVASDQQLVLIQSGHGSRPQGEAYEWKYYFHSEARELATVVSIDPINSEVKTESASSSGAYSFLAQMAAIPASFVDSDEALSTVLAEGGGQAFIDSYSSRNLTTYVDGGNLYWLADEPTANTFWHVKILGATRSGIETFERFVDMQTGEILDPTALPVELTSFTAQVTEGANIQLRWETASETNNAGFEVQHRAPEGADFESVAFVRGHGTTVQSKAYRYRVPSVEPGIHRFRLKQIDTDGAFAYSPEVEVEVDLGDQLLFEAPYPNPFRSVSTIRFGVPTDGPVHIDLFDALGRHVRTLHAGKVEGGQMYERQIEATGLASGLYFIRMQSPSGRIQSQSITVVR